MAEHLIIRADSGGPNCTGHVMRCLALAQAWVNEGGAATLLTTPATPALEERFRAERVDVVHLLAKPGGPADARQTAELAAGRGAAWVAVDGYHFGADYQRQLKSAGRRLLFLDDNGHAEHYCADLVLNQNFHAHADLYPRREPGTRLLLGTLYGLLRREIVGRREERRSIPAVAGRLLITFGGADPVNLTVRTIGALCEVGIDGLRTDVVLGADNRDEAAIRALTARMPAVTVHRDVREMAPLMAAADLAVASAGGTARELVCLGTPTLVAVLAENQRANAEALARQGGAVNLGWHERLSPAVLADAVTRLGRDQVARRRLSEAGQTLVDGQGAARVVAAMLHDGLRLRPATSADCRLLWEWVNDPDVRAASFRSEPIAWEEHARWFAEKLGDRNCHMFVAIDDGGRPVGEIRFDVGPAGVAELSVSIAHDQRGTGKGITLIRLGAETLFRSTGTSRIHALVKPQNAPSRRAFERAGFRDSGPVAGHDHGAVCYVRVRNS